MQLYGLLLKEKDRQTFVLFSNQVKTENDKK